MSWKFKEFEIGNQRSCLQLVLEEVTGVTEITLKAVKK